MKRFLQYITEGGGCPVVDANPTYANDLTDPKAFDTLNRTLAQVCARGYVNPYSALQAVSKTLAEYGLIVPQVQYLPEPEGEEVWMVQQHGLHPGYSSKETPERFNGMHTNTGITPPMTDSPEEAWFVYFCWNLCDKGTYNCFCIVVDEESLSTLIGTNE